MLSTSFLKEPAIHCDDDPIKPVEDLSPQRLDECDEQGRLIGRSWLRQGLLHGRMERLWTNGKLQLVANYDTGLLDGLLCQFDEDGNPIQVAAYVQGKQHGQTRVFVKGRCVSEQLFSDGEANGPTVTYDDAGQPSAKMNFLNGQINGPVTFFHETRVIRQAYYQSSLLEGEVSDFDRDGGLVQVATYHANMLQGPLRRYWPGGALMEEVIYEQGLPIGPPLRLDIKGRQLDYTHAQPSLLERLEKLMKG